MLVQDFDYHIHTRRCGHAENIDDEQYVKKAIELGYNKLGFSDHIPVIGYEYDDPNRAMNTLEFKPYINSINELKKKYGDAIKIYTGLEANYNPKMLKYLSDMRISLDYMILGMHNIPDEFIKMVYIDESGRKITKSCFPTNYSKLVCEGVKSGLYDIIAHPDNYMVRRESFTLRKDYDMFNQCIKSASKKICQVALEYDIPVEINLSKVIKNEMLCDDEYLYPHSSFWKTASNMGVKVVYGTDTHCLQDMEQANEAIKKINQMFKYIPLNIVKNYDPVESRKNNDKLNDAYIKTINSKKMYHDYLLEDVISKLLEESKNKSLEECINDYSIYLTNIKEEKDGVLNTLIENAMSISESKDMDYEISRLKKLYERNKNVYEKNKLLLEEAKRVFSVTNKEEILNNPQFIKVIKK